jgi:hypothetical protein
VPAGPALAAQCRNQLVRDTGTHQSFSVLGIILIIVIGGLIIIIGSSIDSLGSWIRRRTHNKEWMTQQWESEEVLKLHKAAYVNLGLWKDDSEKLYSASVTFTQNDEEKERGSADMESANQTNKSTKNGYVAVSVLPVVDNFGNDTSNTDPHI